MPDPVINSALSRDKITTASSLLSLGLVVIKELQEKGKIAVFFNHNDEVEICTFFEIQMDALQQEEALQRLILEGYSEEELLIYLKGRSARGGIDG